MKRSEDLAAFASGAEYEAMPAAAKETLKIRVLDGLGCAIGALDAGPVNSVLEDVLEMGGAQRCSLIGGGKSAPDRAALYNSSLVRYLDFNDSFLAKGETCHPSDNLGAVLAAAEYSGADGKDFLAALAAAYQVQCRLSEAAPVRERGFDHTTQGSYALASGISRALGLDRARTANAIAICGTAFNALRVTRTGELSNWKGLAYPNAAFCCTNAVMLAAKGITGPTEVFEGKKGFMETISGPFDIDWSKEGLDIVTRTVLKKFNAEVHSQSAIEGALELKAAYKFDANDIERIDLSVFDVAYDIIGGGREGDKTHVSTKEQADHSLNYLVAVALLDNGVMPEQYAPERITRADVQGLLKRVHVRPDENLSALFPARHACNIKITLKGGRTVEAQKSGYEGFTTNPMGWEALHRKFDLLASPFAGPELRERIKEAVMRLDEIKTTELTGLLLEVSRGREREFIRRRA